MKFGDYGTSNKKTVYFSKQKNEKQNFLVRITGIVGIILSLVYLMHNEYEYNQKMKTLNNLQNNMQDTLSGQDGIRQIYNYNQFNKVIALHNVELQSIISDPLTMLNFPQAGLVSRITEYCQWVEVSHEKKKAIGTKGNKTIYEIERTYSYHKGWHKHQIPSWSFQNNVFYNNPSRNPVPSQDFTNKNARVGFQNEKGFFVDSALLKRQNSNDFIFPNNFYIQPYLWNHGFQHTDGKYLVSKYQESYTQKVAAFMIDGIIDMQSWWETCKAGDIRFSYTWHSVANSYSIIALNENGILKPFSLEGSEIFISYPGHYSTQDMQIKAGEDFLSIRFQSRIYGAIFLVLSILFCYIFGKNLVHDLKQE